MIQLCVQYWPLKVLVRILARGLMVKLTVLLAENSLFSPEGVATVCRSRQ